MKQLYTDRGVGSNEIARGVAVEGQPPPAPLAFSYPLADTRCLSVLIKGDAPINYSGSFMQHSWDHV